MWIIGAIIAAADLFGTMIGLAEVWIKGAISTAVIFVRVCSAVFSSSEGEAAHKESPSCQGV
jgi:hypothetical protein